METVNEKVAEEEKDDTILLCQFRRRKTKGVNYPTPMCLDNTRERGQIAECRENMEGNEDPAMVPMTVVSNVETLVQCASPISRSSMLPEPTTEPLMTENVDNAPLNGPNNIKLDAPDSVKACGKLSARIEHLLKALSHVPSPNISPIESKKASLLDILTQLVNDLENFDSFDALIGLAQQFTELAPASFQSTMDHLRKSIGSIQDLSYKLKNQGPQIVSSLKKKSEMTASMARLRLEVEKKVDGVHTLRKIHSNICRKIEFLRAELMKLQRQRGAIEEQLAYAHNELASLSHQLDDSVADLENVAEAESMRASWDQDMKVFKFAVVGIIQQLRSL